MTAVISFGFWCEGYTHESHLIFIELKNSQQIEYPERSDDMLRSRASSHYIEPGKRVINLR